MGVSSRRSPQGTAQELDDLTAGAGAREADTTPPLPLFPRCLHCGKWERESLEENQEEKEWGPSPQPPGKPAGSLCPFCELFEADIMLHGGP